MPHLTTLDKSAGQFADLRNVVLNRVRHCPILPHATPRRLHNLRLENHPLVTHVGHWATQGMKIRPALVLGFTKYRELCVHVVQLQDDLGKKGLINL
jgi:hypothetical protein